MRLLRLLLVAVGMLLVVVMPVQVRANGVIIENNVSELRVKDANGKRLGTVVGLGAVALRINGRGFVFSIQAADSTLSPQPSGGIRLPIRGTTSFKLYTSTDCSGTPLLEVDPAALLSVYLVAIPGLTLWIADPAATPQELAWHSEEDDGVCSNNANPSNKVLLTVPAIPLVDLLDHFTPPFRVKFK